MMPFYITRYREIKYNTYEKSPPTLTPYTLSRKSGFTLFLPVKMVKTGCEAILQKCNLTDTYKNVIRCTRRRHGVRKYNTSTWTVPAPIEYHSFPPVHARSQTREKDIHTCFPIVSNALHGIPPSGCAWGADSSPSSPPSPTLPRSPGPSWQPVGLSLPLPRGLRSSIRVGEDLPVTVCDSFIGTPCVEIFS
jgi:hypothetical protein